MSAMAQSHYPSECPHFQFAPDSGRIAASYRSATKSADARRGAGDDGELRQAAGAAAWVAADKRGVTRLQPHSSRQSAKWVMGVDGRIRQKGTQDFGDAVSCSPPSSWPWSSSSFRCRKLLNWKLPTCRCEEIRSDKPALGASDCDEQTGEHQQQRPVDLGVDPSPVGSAAAGRR